MHPDGEEQRTFVALRFAAGGLRRYAAKRRRCKAFAFGPSVFNLELLARNIFLNRLTELATIMRLALSEAFDYSTIDLPTNEAAYFFEIPRADYIERDVDGMEHLIFTGGAVVLQNVQSVFIEINVDLQRQVEDARPYLIAAGSQLNEK